MDLGVQSVNLFVGPGHRALMRSALALALVLPLVGCGGSRSDEPKPDASPTVYDGGGTLPNPPDGESLCQPGACNYQSQDCSGGASCLPTTTPPGAGPWPPSCQPAGTTPVGTPCSAWSDCEVGAFCAGMTASTAGVCRTLCCGGDWSACPSGESCIQQLFLLPPGATETKDAVYAGADLCAPVNTCDLFEANACADEPGRTCQIVDPIGNVACALSGDTPIGEPCSSLKRCVEGASCVGARCRRLCRAIEGGQPACPADEGVCVHFARNPEGVGECTELLP